MTTSTAKRAFTVLTASAAALAVWTVAEPIAGVRLDVRAGAGTVQHVGPAAVVLVSLLAGLAGWALLAVLERITARARTAWTIPALLSFAISLTGPLGGRTGGAVAALACLHLVVTAVLITGFRASR
jgi:hypothetical protein